MASRKVKIVESDEFFRNGDLKTVIQTPNGALIKPLLDEGVEDRHGTPCRFFFGEVVKPGQVRGRLSPGLTSMVAIERTGTTHFVAF